MNSYNDSKIFCHTVGTNRAFAQIKLKPNNIKSTEIKIKPNETSYEIICAVERKAPK